MAKVLILLGVIALVVGLGAASYGSLPLVAHETASLSPNSGGYEFFLSYDFSVLSGGHLDGSFSVLNGTPILVHVFNDGDYNAFQNGQSPAGLYAATSVNGTLSVDLTGWETYHVVLQHAPGYGSSQQEIAVDLTSTGLDPGYFVGGIVGIVVGIVLVLEGILSLRKPAPAEPPWQVSEIPGSPGSYSQPLPPPPSAPPTGDGLFRVPPPLPGTPSGEAPAPPASPTAVAAAAAPEASPAAPTGTIVVTLENVSAVPETVRILVNGTAMTDVTVPPGGRQQVRVTAALASPFGSTVQVEAVTSAGRRARGSVFVGARGTAPVALRIG